MDSNCPYNNWSYRVWSVVIGMECSSAGMDCRPNMYGDVWNNHYNFIKFAL